MNIKWLTKQQRDTSKITISYLIVWTDVKNQSSCGPIITVNSYANTYFTIYTYLTTSSKKFESIKENYWLIVDAIDISTSEKKKLSWIIILSVQG